jgi:excisionase family DNA binding protein
MSLTTENRPSVKVGGRHTFPNLRTEDKLALRVNEASVAAGISRSTIYKLMSSGQLRTTKVGGRRLVLREDLQKLLLAGAETTRAPVFSSIRSALPSRRSPTSQREKMPAWR